MVTDLDLNQFFDTIRNPNVLVATGGFAKDRFIPRMHVSAVLELHESLARGHLVLVISQCDTGTFDQELSRRVVFGDLSTFGG
jgi:hypothetical protein